MTDKQVPCEDRIESELRDELAEIRLCLGEAEKKYKCANCGEVGTNADFCEECNSEDCPDPLEDDDEHTIESYQNRILAISKTIVYKVELSWGGPQDYYTVEVHPESHRIMEIEYHFLDWYDGATRRLTGSDFDLVERMMQNILMLEE